MDFDIQAASALAASCALIILVTCSFQNLKSLGQVHGLGDLPAGILLGATSVAQMFHPIEPFPGFIFDLRTVPLALAGAFTGFRAALLAACLACLARFFLSGTGMWSGMLAIVLATLVGYSWQMIRCRGYLKGRLGYFALGVLTCSTFTAALILPETVRIWFFTNAVPLLTVIYLTLLPLLAWIGDRGFLFDTVSQQSARTALSRRDIALMSLPAFIHDMRLDSVLGQGQGAHVVLCLTLRDLSHLESRHSRTRRDGLSEAVLVRITEFLPEIRSAGLLGDRTLLIPLTRDQLKQLDRIRNGIREALHGRPVHLSQQDRHWVSYDLGLLGIGDFSDGGRLAPRKIAQQWHIEVRNNPVTPKRARADHRGDTRFDQFENTDTLFLKARLLMFPAT